LRAAGGFGNHCWRADGVKQGRARTIGLERPFVTALIALGMAGCDPVINVAGANFPAWLLCLLVGAALAGVCRPILVVARLDPYLGPAAIIYSSLAVMFALIVWIVFFNRT
jgi:YtcA-like protein